MSWWRVAQKGFLSTLPNGFAIKIGGTPKKGRVPLVPFKLETNPKRAPSKTATKFNHGPDISWDSKATPAPPSRPVAASKGPLTTAPKVPHRAPPTAGSLAESEKAQGSRKSLGQGQRKVSISRWPERCSTGVKGAIQKIFKGMVDVASSCSPLKWLSLRGFLEHTRDASLLPWDLLGPVGETPDSICGEAFWWDVCWETCSSEALQQRAQRIINVCFAILRLSLAWIWIWGWSRIGVGRVKDGIGAGARDWLQGCGQWREALRPSSRHRQCCQFSFGEAVGPGRGTRTPARDSPGRRRVDRNVAERLVLLFSWKASSLGNKAFVKSGRCALWHKPLSPSPLASDDSCRSTTPHPNLGAVAREDLHLPDHDAAGKKKRPSQGGELAEPLPQQLLGTRAGDFTAVRAYYDL